MTIIERQLNNSLKNAMAYIESNNNGSFPCFISPNRTMIKHTTAPPEIASAALILNTSFRYSPKSKSAEKIILYLKKFLDSTYKFHFFEDNRLLPKDADTTSYVLSSLLNFKIVNKSELQNVSEDIYCNKNENELFMVYFDSDNKNKIDEVAISNICYFLYRVGFEKDYSKNIFHLKQYLDTERYQEGSRYYYSPDISLYFISRLLDFEAPKSILEQSIRTAYEKRAGTPKHVLDIAARLTVGTRLHNVEFDVLKNFLHMQKKNGSWISDAIYKRGSSEEYFGSSYISTSFAVESINRVINFVDKNEN